MPWAGLLLPLRGGVSNRRIGVTPEAGGRASRLSRASIVTCVVTLQPDPYGMFRELRQDRLFGMESWRSLRRSRRWEGAGRWIVYFRFMDHPSCARGRGGNVMQGPGIWKMNVRFCRAFWVRGPGKFSFVGRQGTLG
jgi:hypothetical protein